MVIKLLSLIVIVNLFKYYTFSVRSYINPTITTLAYIRKTIQNTYIAIPFGIFNTYCRNIKMIATIDINCFAYFRRKFRFNHFSRPPIL